MRTLGTPHTIAAPEHCDTVRSCRGCAHSFVPYVCLPKRGTCLPSTKSYVSCAMPRMHAPRAPAPGLAANVTDGSWHMLTLTTRPDGARGYQLYVDGILDNQMTTTRDAGEYCLDSVLYTHVLLSGYLLIGITLMTCCCSSGSLTVACFLRSVHGSRCLCGAYIAVAHCHASTPVFSCTLLAGLVRVFALHARVCVCACLLSFTHPTGLPLLGTRWCFALPHWSPHCVWQI